MTLLLQQLRAGRLGLSNTERLEITHLRAQDLSGIANIPSRHELPPI
ncbi:hypothetical protein [Ignatzschineria ureiclastica]|nr:hypothetical protein [Ignatzschineria ureiclastica]